MGKKSQGTDKLIQVGKSVPRVDAFDKSTGTTVYGADFRLPGMLVGRVLRSPYPHAQIRNINTSSAQKVRGVRAIVTGKDNPGLYGSSMMDRPVVAVKKCRFQGEAVAAVAAECDDSAMEALEQIHVEYEELPGVYDPETAVSAVAPKIHEEMMTYQRDKGCLPVEGTNICHHFRLRHGDIEEAFSKAHTIFEDRYTSHAVHHAPLEVHAAMAQMSGERLSVWTHNDAPYRCRRELAGTFRLPMTQLRIISLPMGGGFGGKGGLNAESIAALLALHVEGRPVRILFTREEVFTSTLMRHPTVHELRTGITADGLLLGREIRIYWDTGAYTEKGPTVATNAGYSAGGPYRIPHIHIDSYCVYSNNPVAGAFRGYGIPQVTWASDCQMDEIARELGLDPLEFRLRNAQREGDTSPTGETLKSVGVIESLRSAAKSIGWNEPKVPGRGKGIAAMNKGGASGYGSSSAFVKVNEDGTIQALTSSVEVGQGAQTILIQIIAEELGVDPTQISLATPDTDVTPYDRSTTASRTTFSMGLALQRASWDVKNQIIDMATDFFEVSSEDIEIVGGHIKVVGSPEQTLSLGQLVFETQGEGAILGRGEYHMEDVTPLDPETGQGSKPVPFWMYGAQAAEVEVDEETGQVRILRLTAAHDVGRAINPKNCEQQLEGAMAMGLSCTLIEEIMLEEGKLLNPTFVDYHICSALDVPQLVSQLVEVPHSEGPFGAKGVGEPALAPTAAAIANAIRDAVGIRFKDLPLSPEVIWEAFKKMGKSGPDD